MNPDVLRSNWLHVNERIAASCRRSGRDPASVRLVAVTKRQPAEWVPALVALGATDLGENYPQELWAKVEVLPDVNASWHLIGHLQTNKARKTFQLVRMIHSVDSLKLLRALNDCARGATNPPRVCLQVNTSDEDAKHGWTPALLLRDAEAIADCRAIPVAGLMTMAALGTDAETARPSFVALREIREALRARTGLALPELSMGMSGDFETAIEEGATLVRIGSALFEGVDS
jgi:PLP dependent protein